MKKFSVDKHKSFQTQLDRSRFYVVPAQEVFAARGLPKELVFVALVESGFTPKARSHASAMGMYQFISSTGKRYGLEQNSYVDERCNPAKAARAAADYLSFLYDSFGAWPLALAAYNAGEKAVQDALDRSGFKTFWELADNGYLPSETRDYVPKVLATVKIIRNPDAYGFRFDPQYHVTVHEPVPVPGGVKLSWLGKKIGVPETALQNCNPELCKSVTPPGCSNYDLCVPVGKGGDLVAALAACPPEMERSEAKESLQPVRTLTSYKVKRGDTWSSLARKYNCPAQSLAALNGSKVSHPLKAGQTLKVPPSKQALAAAAAAAPQGWGQGCAGRYRRHQDQGHPHGHRARQKGNIENGTAEERNGEEGNAKNGKEGPKDHPISRSAGRHPHLHCRQVPCIGQVPVRPEQVEGHAEDQTGGPPVDRLVAVPTVQPPNAPPRARLGVAVVPGPASFRLSRFHTPRRFHFLVPTKDGIEERDKDCGQQPAEKTP